MSIFFRLVKLIALRTGKLRRIYRRYCPTSRDWADFLRRWGGFHHIGDDVSVNVGATVTDPAYVSIGNNVLLSACTLIGHDAIIGMLNRAYGKKLDSVGKIEIRDNSFVGHGAIVMPGVTIGPFSVVAAGSVVSKDVPPGVVVGGVPAKVICTTEQLLERLEQRSNGYPWIELIRQRKGIYDAAMEPELRRMRVEYFYGRSAA